MKQQDLYAFLAERYLSFYLKIYCLKNNLGCLLKISQNIQKLKHNN